MSRFYIVGQTKDSVSVFDVQDMSIEVLSNKEFKKASKLFEINKMDSSNHPFGVKSDGLYYSILFQNGGQELFSSGFPSENNRSNIFGEDISIYDVGICGNVILIMLGCNCFCKYDMEIPMFMFHVIALPLKSLKDAYISIYTKMPIHITSLQKARGMYNEYGGDFPSDCCVDSKVCKVSIGTTSSVFGYSFNSKCIPVKLKIESFLSFLKVE